MRKLCIGRLQNGISYPVGDDIVAAIDFVDLAVRKFNSILEFKGRSINVFCRGSSGAILAALFANYVRNTHHVTIIHIKKEGENSHTYDNPSFNPNYINVIIDDFISSGETLRTVYDKMKYSHQRYNETLSDPIVDCLIISRSVWEKSLNFDPKYIICEH